MGTNKKNDDINLTTISKVGATHLVSNGLWSFDFIQILNKHYARDLEKF